MLYYLVAAIYVITCMVLILVILLQQGKGGDIANAFGGGASQAAFGARSGATVLSRATTVGAIIFVVGAIALGILGQRGPGSVIGGRRPVGPALPAGATLPGTTAPPAAVPKPTAPPSNNGVPAGQGAAPAPTPANPAPVKK
jgi:preprotein translocase subunit SecG